MNHQEAVALMGKKVVVTHEFERKSRSLGHGGEELWWEPVLVKPPRAGWIVGTRAIQRGETHYEGYEEGCSWKSKAAHTCLLVAYWPTTRPVRVPLHSYDEWTSEHEEPKLNTTKWSEQDRKSLRDEMQAWPRDAKGRWIKQGC